jgi:arginase
MQPPTPDAQDGQMDVCLIQVPFHAGDDRHGASNGPVRLLDAGAADLLTSRGITVTVERADRATAFRDTASSSAQENRAVAALVSRAMEAQQLPLVLAGSCTACLGVLAGFDHAGCGAIWLDAHADFNTPESTISGFFPGMTAAVMAGHCYVSYWGQIGDNTPIAEDAIVMLGLRDLSPEAERQRLQRSAIRVVEWRDGRPQGDVLAQIERLRRRVRDVYLHIDLDAFDPEVAPGVIDEPVPGGLSLEDAETIVRATTRHFRIRAATLATYAPDRDRDGRTVRVVLRLIELLGDYAGRNSW